jgi:hypothetical protein
MKKSMVRAFIFSLIVFVVINFLAVIIGYSIDEIIDLEVDRFGDYPAFIPYRMFYGAGYFPWIHLEKYAEAASTGLKFVYMGLFISLIISSIIAGLTGGDLLKAIGGWILTCITCMIMFAILFLSVDYLWGYYCSACTTAEATLIRASIHVLVNLMIFGALAGFIALIIGRSSD